MQRSFWALVERNFHVMPTEGALPRLLGEGDLLLHELLGRVVTHKVTPLLALHEFAHIFHISNPRKYYYN